MNCPFRSLQQHLNGVQNLCLGHLKTLISSSFLLSHSDVDFFWGGASDPCFVA